MNTQQFLLSGWTWSPVLAVLCAAACLAYTAAFGLHPRLGYFLGAMAAFLLALVSPLNAGHGGYLGIQVELLVEGCP